jgi:hypothetical protein
MPSSIVFITKDGRKWTFSSPKNSGAVGAGKHGGFFKSEDGVKSLIKQDARIALNIAEFLSGKIYQKNIPELSAKIHLTRVDESEKISADGKNVYVVSEFIPGWCGDLYSDIQNTLNNDPARSEYLILESLQLFIQLIKSGQLQQIFSQEIQQGNYANFGSVSAPSLLINNIDTHLANLGIVQDQHKKKKLAIIDYGAAFCDMTPTIDPESFTKYLLPHAGEAWNNFLFYPELIKVTPEFVSELDKTSKIDFDETIGEAFTELREFYGLRPIVAFAVRARLIEKLSNDCLNKIEQDPKKTLALISQIEEKFKQNIKQRQQDLYRFSAQIKMDLCVQMHPITKKLELEGSFTSTQNSKISFNEVVFQHLDYFMEAILGGKGFKCRNSTQKKHPELMDKINDKANRVIASLYIAQNNLGLENIENIVKQLNEGHLNKQNFPASFTEMDIENARKLLAEYEKAQKESHLEFVLQRIKDAGINVDKQGQNYLRKNIYLQDALMKLLDGCQGLSIRNAEQQKTLEEYKRDTILLALKGEVQFKTEYSRIVNRAAAIIKEGWFMSFAQTIGNLIVLAFATLTVVGVIAMASTAKQRGGFLFFRGNGEKLATISDELSDDLQKVGGSM